MTEIEIELSETDWSFIASQVASGPYTDESEYIRHLIDEHMAQHSYASEGP